MSLFAPLVQSCFGCMLVAGAFAQSPPMRFEVASIRPSHSGAASRVARRVSPETFAVSGLQVRHLIAIAYGVRPYQVLGGPDWMDARAYDITAKAERPVSDVETHVMLQSLLSDRFQLRLHRETRERQVYVLGVAKGGLKAKESDSDAVYARRLSQGNVAYTRVDMDGFAQWLSREVGETVVNRTNVRGHYDLSLQWRPDYMVASEPSATAGPSLFTAVGEQLGLKLEWQRTPVEFLVIDSVEEPSAN
jgi:uncharacterized protein (TIGR03435 family)